MRQTLLIIDVQNAMFECEGGVYDGEATLQRIKALLMQARAKRVPVVFVQHTEASGEFANENPLREIHEAITPLDSEPVVCKNYWDSFMETDLQEVLNEIASEQLIICGMQTEFCVDTTVRSAFAKGYRDNILVSDGHTTFDTAVASAETIIAHHNNIHGGRFARLLAAKDILFET